MNSLKRNWQQQISDVTNRFWELFYRLPLFRGRRGQRELIREVERKAKDQGD
jgi:hypothetical protein